MKVQTKIINKITTTNHDIKLESAGTQRHTITSSKRNNPLFIVLVDYVKTVGFVQTQALVNLFHIQGLEDVFIDISKDIYSHSTLSKYRIAEDVRNYLRVINECVLFCFRGA